MTSYNPPDEILSIFNSINYLYGNNNLTFSSASRLFLSLSGGTLSGNLYCPNLFSSGSIGGTITTASQTGITTLGTLTGISLNGNINLGSNPSTICNNNLIITGSAASPVMTSGIGIGYSPIISTGRIKAFNYIMSTFNNININEGTIYCKSDKTVGINNVSPTRQLDIVGNCAISTYLQMGTSTDTTRTISCLDSSMANGTSKFITLGKLNTANNQLEIVYAHTSDGSLMNKLSLGLHSNPLLYIVANGGIGLSQSNPQYKLDVTGNANFTEEIRQDGLIIIDTSGQFVGAQGVNTSGRIVSSAGVGISQTNSGFANAEARIYCGSGFAYFGNNSNTLLRMGTNNEDFIICKRNSNGRKATTIGGDTNDTYMLTVSGSLLTRYNSSGYGWFNSSGNSGTGSDTVTDSVATYINGRILCVGEIDCISDVRRKSNIESLDDAYVDKFINEAVPKQFNYDNSVQKSLGYIAQAIYKLNLEGLVSAHPNEAMEELIDDDGFVSPAGSELSVSTGSIIPILHHKIKRMDAQISELFRICESSQLLFEQILQTLL